MNYVRKVLLSVTALGIAACSGDSPSAPIVPNGGANYATYATLDEEINATIPILFPNKGLTTATGERWESVKSALAAGNVAVARKTLTNLSTFIVSKTVPTQKSAASRLILDMALYVYNGPSTPPPGTPGTTVQTAAGVVEPTTQLTLTTAHTDGGLGDGGIHIDVGSVATTTIAVISEVVGDYTADCSGPFDYSGCQEPKFFRITLFPHDKLLKPGQVQICHINRGTVRLPLGDHEDLRPAHEKPKTPSLYTAGGTIVEGIEILPFDATINFLTSAGACKTTYDNSLPPAPIGFLNRLIAPGTPLNRLASAIGGALSPKSLYAIDLGGGGLFESESIFGLVNPNININDGCVTTACPNPVIALKNVEPGVGGEYHNLTVTNRDVYPTQLFAASPSLPPCGANTSASRTWVSIHDGSTGAQLNNFCALGSPADLDGIWYFVPNDALGPATVYVKLTDRLTGRVYQSNTISTTADPTITSLSLNSPSITIDGDGTDYQAVVHNPGTSSEAWVLQGWIDQGSASRAAGGTMVQCGSGNGILPAGDCNSTFSVSVNNTTSSGSGTLVPGAATFRLQLIHNETVVDTRSVPITLTALGQPTVTSLTMDSPDIVIEGAGTGYTVVMHNPGAAAVTGIVLQGWLTQPSGAERAAGGVVAICGAGNGVLPAGDCTQTWSAGASNSAAGTGTLVPGPATFRFELKRDGVVIDTKTAAVNLIAGTTP